MPLRQTYLSMKGRLPPGAEAVIVIHGRGNDELAPPKALLDEFNAWKAKYTPDSGYPTAFHFAWDKTHYEQRFREHVLGNSKAIDRLRELALRAKTRDVFLICYEAEDKPCHRHLLLEIARDEVGATIDPSPLV